MSGDGAGTAALLGQAFDGLVEQLVVEWGVAVLGDEFADIALVGLDGVGGTVLVLQVGQPRWQVLCPVLFHVWAVVNWARKAAGVAAMLWLV